MENFTLYAKASGRCATWRTFPFDSGESYSPRYYYTGNIGQKTDFTFWSRKPSRVFLGILFRYGGTKLIQKLFVYNSYTLFWQKIRFEIFWGVRGGPRSWDFQIWDFGWKHLGQSSSASELDLDLRETEIFKLKANISQSVAHWCVQELVNSIQFIIFVPDFLKASKSPEMTDFRPFSAFGGSPEGFRWWDSWLEW